MKKPKCLLENPLRKWSPVPILKIFKGTDKGDFWGLLTNINLFCISKIASFVGDGTIPTESEPFSRGVLFFWFVFFWASKRK